MMKAIGFPIAILVIALVIDDAHAQPGGGRRGQGEEGKPPRHHKGRHHGPRICRLVNTTTVTGDELCNNPCPPLTNCTKGEPKPGMPTIDDLDVYVCRFQACNPENNNSDCPPETTCTGLNIGNETINECRPSAGPGGPRGDEGSEGPAGARGGPNGGRREGPRRGPRHHQSSDESDSAEDEVESLEREGESHEESCKEMLHDILEEAGFEKPQGRGPNAEGRPPKSGQEQGGRVQSNEPRRQTGRRPYSGRRPRN